MHFGHRGQRPHADGTGKTRKPLASASEHIASTNELRGSNVMQDLHALDVHRRRGPNVVSLYGGIGDETCGAFELPSPIDKASMLVIASSGGGWDHVSVSRANRCPNWPEMEFVRVLFFKKDETVMQLHVPAPDHINVHPHCLHLWRPQHVEIPRPPELMV